MLVLELSVPEGWKAELDVSCMCELLYVDQLVRVSTIDDLITASCSK